jgi:hypothetical protein
VSVSSRIADRVAALVDGHTGEGGALRRATTVAAALSVSPLRYITRPLSPEAVLVAPGDCQTGSSDCCGPSGYSCDTTSSCISCGCKFTYTGQACEDGWTTFCCSLSGEDNYGCPSYAWVGGWWKCTCYAGSSLCGSLDNPRRYYVDCNTAVTGNCPNGCRCANNSCSYRRTCCNPFRYWNSTPHPGVQGYVVCRLVTCKAPYNISCLNATSTYQENNCTCNHEAACLG